MSFDWKEILKSLKNEVIPRRWDMQEFVQNFFEGLFLVVPVAVTIYVVFLVFSFIDGWLNIPVPGIGFILTIGMLILVGRLASNVFFRGALGSLEKVLTRTPFVKWSIRHSKTSSKRLWVKKNVLINPSSSRSSRAAMPKRSGSSHARTWPCWGWRIGLPCTFRNPTTLPATC